MDISGLDFVLINIISYVCGLATGLIICCKNKDKLLVKSRSLDNLSLQQRQQNHIHHPPSQQYNQPIESQYTTPPLIASAPASIEKSPVKITLE